MPGVDRSGIRLGPLSIEFGVLAGDIERVGYRADQIEMDWIDEPFEPAEPVRSAIVPVRREFLDTLARAGRPYDPTPLARLCGYSAGPERLRLTVQPTDYAAFAATNLALDRPIVSGGPHREGVSIRSLLAAGPLGIPAPFLANPLNVIAMLVTRDGFTFVPRRSGAVHERPNTWQASVGGGVEFREHPAHALLRELKEEWGVEAEPGELAFVALGVNQRTGEPDLIARVQSGLGREEVCEQFRARSEQVEFREFVTLELATGHLAPLLELLRGRPWSQPSDETAFLATLVHEFGRRRVRAELERAL